MITGVCTGTGGMGAGVTGAGVTGAGVAGVVGSVAAARVPDFRTRFTLFHPDSSVGSFFSAV